MAAERAMTSYEKRHIPAQTKRRDAAPYIGGIIVIVLLIFVVGTSKSGGGSPILLLFTKNEVFTPG